MRGWGTFEKSFETEIRPSQRKAVKEGARHNFLLFPYRGCILGLTHRLDKPVKPRPFAGSRRRFSQAERPRISPRNLGLWSKLLKVAPTLSQTEGDEREPTLPSHSLI